MRTARGVGCVVRWFLGAGVAVQDKFQPAETPLEQSEGFRKKLLHDVKADGSKKGRTWWDKGTAG